MKDKLLVSFSGGRTSGYMLKWCYDNLQDDYELLTVFANTGKEVEGTLEFVEECSKQWGIPIIWVEAKHKDKNGNPYSKKGWKTKHRIVDFETASRNGEPFEELISMQGIPSSNAPFCSYQLKKKAIESLLKELGWKDYYKAIGIRADEFDRVSDNYLSQKIIYPLITHCPTTRAMVDSWWHKQDFKLNIDLEYGNCDNCWKKNTKLLTRNAKKKDGSFDWWQKMTDKYGHLNPRDTDLEPPFNFYRGNISPKDIIEMAKLTESEITLFDELNKTAECGESCEAF